MRPPTRSYSTTMASYVTLDIAELTSPARSQTIRPAERTPIQTNKFLITSKSNA